MTTSQIKETALYLTFSLETELFALDVYQVREILDMTSITKVPAAPKFMRGIINVRGSVVPVVDLRMKFGLSTQESTVNTRIIILEIAQEDSTHIIGAVADSVNDVLELSPENIEEAPHLGSRWHSEFIRGIGKHEDKFIIILNINKVFSSDDLATVQNAGTVMASDTAGRIGENTPLPGPQLTL